MLPKVLPRIALTPGEPAGIGPDLCIQLAQSAHACEIVAICDPELLEQRAQQLNLTLKLHEFNPDIPVRHPAGSISILSTPLAVAVECGRLNIANAHYVLNSIRMATQGCIDGYFDAMVTAPVHKAILNTASITFTGHTEYIAGLTGGNPVMMLATPGLRVALVTTHLPISKVSAAITPDRLETVIQILARDLNRYFGLPNPAIFVCGLNPHAGENGHLGLEEITVIEPVLDKLRKQGMNLIGPLPADTLFTPKYLDQADAVLSMYHDQGLPVLKYKGFGKAVNITLGLPVIRTSVDHGTALDLAGTGKADPGSLRVALTTALEMSTHKLLTS